MKLKGTEQNLARVDDVIEKLAGQLAQLERGRPSRRRATARSATICAMPRGCCSIVAGRRPTRPAPKRPRSPAGLHHRGRRASRAAARDAARDARKAAEEALPALREEEAVAGAILQRLQVERDTLAEQEARARDAHRRAAGRIEQFDA